MMSRWEKRQNNLEFSMNRKLFGFPIETTTIIIACVLKLQSKVQGRNPARVFFSCGSFIYRNPKPQSCLYTIRKYIIEVWLHCYIRYPGRLCSSTRIQAVPESNNNNTKPSPRTVCLYCRNLCAVSKPTNALDISCALSWQRQGLWQF